MAGTIQERNEIYDYPDGTSRQYNPMTREWDLLDPEDTAPPDVTKGATDNFDFGSQQKLLESHYQGAKQRGYNYQDPTQKLLDTLDNLPVLGGVAEHITPLFRGGPGNQMANARDNWVDVEEKKRTGKAALQAEKSKYRKIFFPVAGDDAQGVKNKEALRAKTFEGKKAGASRLAPRMGDYWDHKVVSPEDMKANPPSAAQMKTVKLYKGSKARPGTRENPFVPRTIEELKALPGGSTYVDDDGSLQTR